MGRVHRTCPVQLVVCRGVFGRRLEILEQFLERPGGFRIAEQPFLHLLDLLHQFLGLGLLCDLEKDGLAGGGDDHLGLLTEHLDALAAQTRPSVVAVTQLQPQVVELSLQR